MRIRRLMIATALIIITIGLALSFPLTSKCSENNSKEGKVHAVVFYGRTSFGTQASAEMFYDSLLENKLPGYRTNSNNIYLVGKENKLLENDTPLTKKEVDEALDRCFSSSEKEDLCILYYAGHGDKGTKYNTDVTNDSNVRGGLCFGWDNMTGVALEKENGVVIETKWEGFTYFYDELLNKLRSYDFKRFIIVIDGCYTGLINESINSCDDIQFKEKLCVMTSTGSDINNSNNEESFFTFTEGILKTSGALDVLGVETQEENENRPDNALSLTCDENKDGVVIVKEAFDGGRTSPSEYSELAFLDSSLKDNQLHNPYFYPDNTTVDTPLFQFQYLDINKKSVSIFEGNDNGMRLKAFKHYIMTDQHKIRWTSEDDKIAVVDQDGNVVGVCPGTTTITVHLDTKDDVECLGAEAKCEVTVNKVSTDIKDDGVSIYLGQKSKVTYTIEGPKKNGTWISDDETIATVKNGTIKGIKPGITTIKLEANGKSDSVQVEVMEPYIEADDMTLKVGETSQIMYKVFGPKGDIEFESSNKNVVSVDSDGMVAGLEVGTSQITMKANGATTTIEVTVEQLDLTMESVGLAYGHYEGIKPQGDGAIPTELNLYKDGTFRLHCSFDLFSQAFGDHTYSGSYTVDRINDNGYPVLSFDSDKQDFEMVFNGSTLEHDNFFIWID